MTARLAVLRSLAGSMTSFSSLAAGEGGTTERVAPKLGFGGTGGRGFRYDCSMIGRAGDETAAGDEGSDGEAVGWLKCLRSRVLQRG